MARLDAPNPPGKLLRLATRILERRQGKVPASIGILGHHPRILAAFMAFGAFFDGADKLPPRIRKLVHLRVAMRIGCPT